MHDTNRLFLGSLDDSVSRYPWSQEHDIESINHLLIMNAIIGPSLCCRIGNILYNETNYGNIDGEKSIINVLNENKSPLIHLARSGFFQIQTKDEGINDSISCRLELKTNSTIRFCDYFGWKHSQKLKQEYAEIENRLEEGKGRKKYSPNFVDTFRKICRDISPNVKTPFGNVYQEWIQLSDDQLTRSNFEEIAKKRFESSVPKLLAAMQPINSINHHAYGIGAGTKDDKVLFESKTYSELERYANPYLGQNSTYADYKDVESVLGRQLFDDMAKILLIPQKLFNNPEKWQKFSSLLDPDQHTSSNEFLEIKKQIVSKISNSLKNVGSANEIDEIPKLCRNLSELINKHLGTNTKSDSQLSISIKLREFGKLSLSGTVGTAIDEALDLLPETPLDMPLDLGLVTVLIYATAMEYANSTISETISRTIGTLTVKPEENAYKFERGDISGSYSGLSTLSALD